MFLNKKYMTMCIALLSLNCVANAATDAVTELEIQEKTAKMINQSDEGLEVKIMDDGTEYVDLKGRYQMFSKIKMVDGKQVFVCDGNSDINHSNHQHSSSEIIQQPKRAVK